MFFSFLFYLFIYLFIILFYFIYLFIYFADEVENGVKRNLSSKSTQV